MPAAHATPSPDHRTAGATGRAQPAAPGAARPRAARSARETLLDQLYLLLRDREERRRARADRRVLDRGGQDRRAWPALQATAGTASASLYLRLASGVAAILLAAIMLANYLLAPELYNRDHLARIAERLAAGQSFGVFDLNLDIREVRRQHIARLPRAPEVVMLGASHWQEAHAGLLPGRDFYNAHVHRDYYEDLLSVVEMLLRHDRLPATLILSIRDNTFMAPAERDDFLWVTGLAEYRAMARRLGIPRHDWIEANETRHWLGLVSVANLVGHLARELRAERPPGPTRETELDSLDLLLPDGSIRWATERWTVFTPERTRVEVQNALRARSRHAPTIDDRAVEAVDRLLALLRARGVRPVLIHPPFNPEFYRAIQGTPYASGLRQVEEVTRRLARAHGAVVAGGFDPATTGCTTAMYIDAEHSSPDCLRRVLAGVSGL